MISYYLNRGHKLDYLLNLTYLEKKIFIASMLYEHEIDLNEKIDLNPFLKRKGDK